MNSRTTPYRSEVARWSPEDLADFFRRLNYKDCEKVAKKYNITGQRFLNMSENDIQKFPKLSVPIVTKLSQEIKRNEERKSFFPKRLHPQKFPETTEYRQEEDNGWSSFEDDDYESPDEQDGDDGVDYETPDDTNEIEEGDYEPPPPNDEEAHGTPVFPPHKISPNSEYIDRPPTDRSKAYPQPPVPPKRPEPSPAPAVPSYRTTAQPPFQPPSISPEINREQSTKSFRPPAPSVDRSKKPPLNRPALPFEKDITGAGKAGIPKLHSLTPQLRSLGEELAKIPKPPVPPTDRCERSSPASRRMTPPLIQPPGRKTEAEDANVSQRSLPQPPPQFFNTIPSRPKPSNLMAYADSGLSLSASIPPRLQPGSICRSPSKGPADSRPPLPPPNKQRTQPVKAEHEGKDQCHKYNEAPLKQKWYAADITRPEAEVTLRNINQDGTFLVRDSSKKSIEQPYVLMVLYNNKVYNIKIRYQEEDQTYILGTGMKGNEDFTSVDEIIEYFQRMPLRLIDANDRGSRKQCMLTYPAGPL